MSAACQRSASKRDERSPIRLTAIALKSTFVDQWRYPSRWRADPSSRGSLVRAHYQTDPEDRNVEHNQATVRYLTIFDKAFGRASETSESEFVKALLCIGSAGCQVGPVRNDRASGSAMVRLHAQIPDGDEEYETSRHLALWTYGHTIEVSERC
jgi:hypothetical protein